MVTRFPAYPMLPGRQRPTSDVVFVPPRFGVGCRWLSSSARRFPGGSTLHPSALRTRLTFIPPWYNRIPISNRPAIAGRRNPLATLAGRNRPLGDDCQRQTEHAADGPVRAK